MVLQKCRACLVLGTDLQDLSEDVKNAFEDILGFTINFNNVLPSHICYICKARIIRYAEFKKLCRNVQDYLQRKLLSETQVENNVEECKDIFQAQRLTINEVYNYSFMDSENETENDTYGDNHIDYDSDCDEPKDMKIEAIMKNETNSVNTLNIEFEDTQTEIQGPKDNNNKFYSIKPDLKDVILKVKPDHKDANIGNHVKIESILKDTKFKKQEAKQSSDIICLDSDEEESKEAIIKKTVKPDLKNVNKNTNKIHKKYSTDKIKIITGNDKYKLFSTTITKISKTNKNNIKNAKVKVDPSKKQQITSKKQQLSKKNMKLKKLIGEKLKVKVMKWQCAECKFVFVSEQALSKHNQTCKLGFRACGACGAGFSDALALHTHLATEHNVGNEPNAYCQQFVQQSNNVSGRKGLVKCKVAILDAQIQEQDSNVKQREPETQNEGVICDQCGKQLKCQAQLRYHMTSHTGEKPYKCNVCGRAFRVKYGLHTHMMMHSDERPFKCSVCPMTFRQHSHRLRHIRTHTGEKPYECTHCGKSFGTPYNRNEHIRTVHEGQPARQRAQKRKLAE